MVKFDNRSLNKRFKPLYVASFLQGFVFWYAIEKLFMKSIGFNDRTIAIETIIFTVVMLVANIPIGILADRWSRKGVLILASCSMVIDSLIAGFSHGFWIYLLSACFWGLFYACYQGVYDSVVYDTLIEETGSANDFEHYYGRIVLYDGLALVLGSLLSAVIVHYFNLRAAYFMTIPFTLCSIVALHYFREPKVHKKEVAQLVGAHIRSTFKAVLQKGEALWIVITLVLITAVMRVLLEFDQLWLIALILPITLYGPFNALLLTSFSSGGFIAGKLKSEKTIMVIGIVGMLASLILLTRHRFLIIIAQTIIITGLVIINISFDRRLHNTLSSKVRVGATSIVTTIGYIIFLPLAYVFGEISNKYNIFHAAWIVIVILLAVLLSGVRVISFGQLIGVDKTQQ